MTAEQLKSLAVEADTLFHEWSAKGRHNWGVSQVADSYRDLKRACNSVLDALLIAERIESGDVPKNPRERTDQLRTRDAQGAKDYIALLRGESEENSRKIAALEAALEAQEDADGDS